MTEDKTNDVEIRTYRNKDGGRAMKVYGLFKAITGLDSYDVEPLTAEFYLSKEDAEQRRNALLNGDAGDDCIDIEDVLMYEYDVIEGVEEEE